MKKLFTLFVSMILMSLVFIVPVRADVDFELLKLHQNMLRSTGTKTIVPKKLPKNAKNKLKDYDSISKKIDEANTRDNLVKNYGSAYYFGEFYITSGREHGEKCWTADGVYTNDGDRFLFADGSGFYYDADKTGSLYVMDSIDAYKANFEKFSEDFSKLAPEVLAANKVDKCYISNGKIWIYEHMKVDYNQYDKAHNTYPDTLVETLRVYDSKNYRVLAHFEYANVDHGNKVVPVCSILFYYGDDDVVKQPPAYQAFETEFHRTNKQMLTISYVLNTGEENEVEFKMQIPKACEANISGVPEGYSVYKDREGTIEMSDPEHPWDRLSDLTLYFIKDK